MSNNSRWNYRPSALTNNNNNNNTNNNNLSGPPSSMVNCNKSPPPLLVSTHFSSPSLQHISVASSSSMSNFTNYPSTAKQSSNNTCGMLNQNAVRNGNCNNNGISNGIIPSNCNDNNNSSSSNNNNNNTSNQAGNISNGPTNTFNVKLNCDNHNFTGQVMENNFNDDFPPIGIFSSELYSSNSIVKPSPTLSPSVAAGLNLSLSPKQTKNGIKLMNQLMNDSSNNNNNNNNNQLIRETGIIEKLLHSYGFIQCCERQARLFFHFSQFSGTIEHLKIGDPVEFEMTYDRRTGKPIASTVTKIAPDVVLSEERVTGTVTADLDSKNSTNDIQARITYENKGECFFLPFGKDDIEGNVTLRIGDEVSFQMATNNKGNLSATHIRLENTAHPVTYQGVICSLKEDTGYIERADVVKEILFCLNDIEPGTLSLGDDVEFNIKTQNGKEIAYNIDKLADGTVIFEDISEDLVKGQVLKTYEKNSPVENGEPAPGKIKYRASDHSEVEVAYGGKDQLGEFTLRHGDWVEFRLATDRRDQLKRATCISLLEDSFLVSGEKRELGLVTRVKDDHGYLQPVERNYKVLFKLTELLDANREVAVGDEFEFTIIQDPFLTFSNNTRLIGIRLKHVKSGSAKFDKLIEPNVTGIITRLPMDINGVTDITVSKQNSSDDEQSPEPGLISFLHHGVNGIAHFFRQDCEHGKKYRIDHKVKFDLYQVKRNKQFIAKNIENVLAFNAMTNGRREHNYNIRKEREMRRSTTTTTTTSNDNVVKQMHRGYVVSLKDGFGFIEMLNYEKEIYFNFSNVDGDAQALEVGSEVEYTIGTRGNSNSSSGNQAAENVRSLAKGTIVTSGTLEENQPVFRGVVKRPIRSHNADQSEYCGLIKKITEDGETDLVYGFGIVSMKEKSEVLKAGDYVSFQVNSCGNAVNIKVTRTKLQSTVEALKGPFGFLSYQFGENRKKLFFHMSQVKSGNCLKPGDTVEFFVTTNNRTGRSAATDVVKLCSNPTPRPVHLVNRVRSTEQSAPNVSVRRLPRGPDENTNGFSAHYRKIRSLDRTKVEPST